MISREVQLVSVDHFRHELPTQLRSAADQGGTTIVIISGELCKNIRMGSSSTQACCEAMLAEVKPGDVIAHYWRRLRRVLKNNMTLEPAIRRSRLARPCRLCTLFIPASLNELFHLCRTHTSLIALGSKVRCPLAFDMSRVMHCMRGRVASLSRGIISVN
jgi:hypothetical protein